MNNSCQQLHEVLTGTNIDAQPPVDADIIRLLDLGATDPAIELLLITGHHPAAPFIRDPSEETVRRVTAAGVTWPKALFLIPRIGRALARFNDAHLSKSGRSARDLFPGNA